VVLRVSRAVTNLRDVPRIFPGNVFFALLWLVLVCLSGRTTINSKQFAVTMMALIGPPGQWLMEGDQRENDMLGHCNEPWQQFHSNPTRRQLLRIGALGMLGLSLPSLLRARAASPMPPLRGGRARSCIFVVQYGGASHIDTLDPKPDAPDNMRGPYRPIATTVPGTRLGELLPRLARLAGRYCLVRSMSHGAGDHDGGMHVCMTGHSRPRDNTPCLGSVVARLRPVQATLPSYVWLQNLDADVRSWYLTGGFLGPGCAPLAVGRGADNPSAANFRFQGFDPPGDVPVQRLTQRQQLLAGLESGQGPYGPTPTAQTMRRFQERAVELVTGPEARRAFDLAREPDRLRDRYGRHPLGQNLLLARRLIEAGVRLVTVNAWAGVPRQGEGFIYSPSFTQGWDHHGAAVQRCGIFSNGQFGLGLVLPRFDQALSALLEDLETRGLLEETLVVVVGEFGRTPRITTNPHPGRDHWPACYSALLAGAGVRGGLVHGASDRIGAYVRDNPVSPEDFAATLLETLGVAPQTRLSPDGATLPASTGQPLVGLFG
jgi:hypothetical protein